MTQTSSHTVTITSPAPAYRRNQAPDKATHRLTNHLSDWSTVGTACGRVFSDARCHMTIDDGRGITCRACRA